MKIITILISVFYILLISCTANEKEPQKKESESEEFSVMSFNVLYSTSVSSTLKTIKATHADIIGLQEASENRIKVSVR